MSHALNPRINRSASAAHSAVLTVCVVYDDEASRQRAMGAVALLEQDVGVDFDLRFSWWKSSHLRDSIIASVAADTASHADLVLCALSPRGELPEATRSWMQKWAGRRQVDSGALILLSPSGASVAAPAPAVVTYLQSVANQAQMDLICESAYGASKCLREGADCLDRRATAVTPLLDGIIHRPIAVPRWGGINE